MRIQARLFLGTSVLMAALIGLQWWLQTRNLQAIEDELTGVATFVGEFMLRHPLPPSPPDAPDAVDEAAIEAEREAAANQAAAAIDAVVAETTGVGAARAALKAAQDTRKQEIQVRRVVVHKGGKGTAGTVISGAGTLPEPPQPPRPPEVPALPEGIRVEALAAGADRFLVIRGAPGGDRQIPVPISDSRRMIQAALQQSLWITAALLLAGLGAAAVFAHRVTRPLRQLADGADALGRGDLGTQVAVTDRGEIGDLQLAFNRMSLHLAELEAEKARWRAREHLAELGDVARGLAHTLRNPLHTLGLAVEELGARTTRDSQDLVDMARHQIRRVDGWLRSFLAVGAGPAAEPGPIDLGDLVRDVALEAVQAGGQLEVSGEERLAIVGVAPALRAALANLVGNAVEASPPDAPVVIHLERDGDQAEIRIIDRGPGLPLEVRERLFSPHTTTRAAGSGMGLFLARQLIEGGHGGSLELRDGPEGGTIARVRLPLPQQTPDTVER